MDGYIIVRLIGNTTFDGRNFTALKASDIESAYGTWAIPHQPNVTGVVRNITRETAPNFSDSPAFPEFPEYERFFGLWTWTLWASTIVLPLVAWVASAARKWYIDKHHRARVTRQRASTPTPEQAIRAAEVQEWEASPWEQAVVLFVMSLWRGIQLAIGTYMVVFQFKLLPRLGSPEFVACMQPRWNVYPPTAAHVFLGFHIWTLSFAYFGALIRIAATAAVLKRSNFLGDYQLFHLDYAWLEKWKLYLTFAPDIIAFAFAMCIHYLLPCVNDKLHEDLKLFMISYAPLCIWSFINRYCGIVTWYYRLYWGMPRTTQVDVQ
ncbi:hypothetical protein PG993_005002 [Apiospora rasikravindrae]|uniref:Uncharacterized protein n=1 Tax=Apiospora rasikravindrae TaxID=990691 RepID=A0ABR1TEF2_9PEZI